MALVPVHVKHALSVGSLKGTLAMTTATARKTSLKINTGPIVTIFDCPILFVFYIVGKVRYKWIGVRDVKLNTEN